MKRLPPEFLFSQHSLSTYQRCPRRFWLRYVEDQPWPLPERGLPPDYQLALQRGVTLHRWIERVLRGVPPERIVPTGDDPRLAEWWQAWLGFDWGTLPDELRVPELPLVCRFGEQRLYARYDLVALERGGRAVVVDWKTLQHVPRPAALRTRLQTRIYLCVLTELGGLVTGGTPVDPQQLEMLYWFANFPESTATVGYSPHAYAADKAELTELMARIASADEAHFVRTDELALCASCNYRTLCERVVDPTDAAATSWLDEDADFQIDLASVPLIDW